MIALRELAVPEENIYMDKQSGKDFDSHDLESRNMKNC